MTTKDPHKTVEFAAVPAKIDTASRPPGPRSSGFPGWSDDEIATSQTAEYLVSAPPAAAVRDRALLTVLTGLNGGQVFTLEKPETVIGRGKDAVVRIDDVGISRLHARVVRGEDGRYVLEDLRSTNGVFLNGRRVERADLKTGDRVQVGPTAILRFALIDAAEEALARQLYESSTRDSLTRAFNRKYLAERLTAEVAYALRHKTRLSVVIFDLDHFKKTNDSHGHLAGDVVLRIVAGQVARLIRTEDVFARYGGEEFVVLVRGIEHANVALFAERIRKSIEKLAIPWESITLKATVSLGIASLGECEPPTGEAIMTKADDRLYKAKDGGRNRVCSS